MLKIFNKYINLKNYKNKKIYKIIKACNLKNIQIKNKYIKT